MRGSVGGAFLANSTGLTAISWSFAGIGGGTLTGENQGNTSWVGYMAVGGTITVSFQYPNAQQDIKSCSIAIGARSWHTTAPAPQQVTSNLVTPPTTAAHLGRFLHHYGGGGGLASIAVIEGGPNRGFVYFSQPPVPIVQYMINADLEAPSTFFSKQCGQSGFISGNDLFDQTVRHEVGATHSHYALYASALNTAANNYGDYLENKTRIPGTTQEIENWLAGHIGEMDDRLNAIQATANNGEPRNDSPANLPAVNYDQNNDFLGNVNFGPNYQNC